MRLAELVAALHEAFDADLALADVRAICEHDRYQACAGITAAAAYVAERAQAAGLSEVEVLSFPADGTQRWWTYQAPRSWTPVRATLAIDGQALVRYPEQPYSLAAYSAPTPPGGRSLPLIRCSSVLAGADPAGALVVADEPVSLGALAGPMTAAGAVAIAADPLSGVPRRSPNQVGRLELPAGSGLAAFSVTEAQLDALIRAAGSGAAAQVNIELDPAVAAMPVVTGLLPASGPGGPGDGTEVLLSAHLCHPRPGANDNASGVAALLGIARALAAARFDGGRAGTAVRFVWGPEFVGTAAYLCDVVGAGRAASPWLAINIDMAGQDVARCGGPLVIERGPDDIASFLPALASRCAALLPPASRSYSGAVPCDLWTWRETPFAGGSDHALLADEPTRCQAIGLGHWPDRANHSSADTPDLVDPAELRRTAVIAAASVAAVRGRGDPELAADVAEATLSWAAEHVLAVLPGRRAPGSPPKGEPAFDPQADLNAVRWLQHRGAVALASVEAVAPATGADSGWLPSTQAWLTALIDATAARLPPSPKIEAEAEAGQALIRCWTGPANLRALAGDADPADRQWLNEQLAADRGGNYARALAMMRGVNGERDRDELSWWAALSSELPVPLSFADRFVDLMDRAGWVRPERERAQAGSLAGQP